MNTNKILRDVKAETLRCAQSDRENANNIKIYETLYCVWNDR